MDSSKMRMAVTFVNAKVCELNIQRIIRIKSGEPGFLGFSMPGRLGGVICKPEGVA